MAAMAATARRNVARVMAKVPAKAKARVMAKVPAKAKAKAVALVAGVMGEVGEVTAKVAQPIRM